MRRLLLPNSRNNYTPFLLHRSALVVYVLVIFLFNVIVGQLQISTVQAAVDAPTLYSLHNSNRAANGLTALTVNSQLVTSATNKANAMLESDCWDHYCPPGTSPWSFILNAGYEYVYAGENLGEGFSSNSTLMNAWMNSATHRANIMNGNFTEIGIGFAYGSYQGNPNNTIAVVHFGSRQKVSPTATPKPVEQISTNSGNTSTPKTISPTAVTQVQPTTVPNVLLEAPSEGSVLNDAKPEIKGQKPNASTLDIIINDKSIGRVEVQGSSFSYRPLEALPEGAQKLKAIAYINNKVASESQTVNFTIDTLPPVIDEESLEISYKSEQENSVVNIRLKATDDSTKITTNIEGAGFTKLETGEWSIDLEKTLIPPDTTIVIVSEDAAGNQSILELPSEDILGYFDHNLYLSQEFDESSITKSSPFSSSLLANVETGGIRTQVNFVFILFLFGLFMLDFYVIHKSGLTGMSRSKPHLQVSAMFVLLLIILLGGLGGKII